MRVIGLAGWSGAGKTTLLLQLVPYLIASGLRISTIKHAHHEFEIDKPGKDSWHHRQSGATEVLISSARRWALIHELRDESEPDIGQLLSRLSPVDIVLVEGFKSGKFPKIEIHRPVLGKPLLHLADQTIVAIATDVPIVTPLPQIDLGNIPDIAEQVLKHATWSS